MTYVRQLDSYIQKGSEKELEKAITKTGLYTPDEIKVHVESGMNSRVSNLEDIIDIYNVIQTKEQVLECLIAFDNEYGYKTILIDSAFYLKEEQRGIDLGISEIEQDFSGLYGLGETNVTLDDALMYYNKTRHDLEYDCITLYVENMIKSYGDQPIPINNEISEFIIEHRKPLGIFYLETEDSCFIGIDNSNGEAFVEEFAQKELCQLWLKDGSLEYHTETDYGKTVEDVVLSDKRNSKIDIDEVDDSIWDALVKVDRLTGIGVDYNKAMHSELVMDIRYMIADRLEQEKKYISSMKSSKKQSKKNQLDLER